jgi:hypothetical protein
MRSRYQASLKVVSDAYKEIFDLPPEQLVASFLFYPDEEPLRGYVR